MTIQLSTPVRKGEREITALTFAEPKVKHLLAADKHPIESHAGDLAMVSALTSEPESLLKEIGPRDWARIRRSLKAVMRDFFLPDDEGDPTEAGPPEPASS